MIQTGDGLGHELFDTFNRGYKESLVMRSDDEECHDWHDLRGLPDLELVAVLRNVAPQLIAVAKAAAILAPMIGWQGGEGKDVDAGILRCEYCNKTDEGSTEEEVAHEVHCPARTILAALAELSAALPDPPTPQEGAAHAAKAAE